MSNEILLELKEISFSVNRKGIVQYILKNINLKIFSSEIFGLTGESGSGKTTFGEIISGLEKPTLGKKYFNGKEFSGIHPQNKIQFLFQNYYDSFDPIQKIDSAFNEFLKINNINAEDGFREKKLVLDLVGLSDDLINRFPHQLSGGQLQRLALARLLLLKPELLILDEPFASQDVDSIVNFIKILKRVNEEQKITIICIAHDIPVLIKLCNRIGFMKGGEFVEIVSIDNSGVVNFPSARYARYFLESFGIKCD